MMAETRVSCLEVHKKYYLCSKQCEGNRYKLSAIKYLSKELQSEVAQSCLTLCNPMDCSLPGSSVHGIFQAIVLEWIAISFSRGSSQPRDQTWVSRVVKQPLYRLRHQGMLMYINIAVTVIIQ